MNNQEVMIFLTKEELKRFITLQEKIFDQVSDYYGVADQVF